MKLIHIIEIEPYQTFVSEITDMINKNIPKENPFLPFLEHELSQVRDLVNNIKIQKRKRSLNFIGSAWKWIAGNPDHDDLILMTDRIDNIVENNNNQVIINQAHNDRINKLTNVTNEILNMIRRDRSFEIELVLSLQYKLKLIKEEITNTIYAIELAKSNTISSNILSKAEINIVLESMNKDNIPYNNVEEALKFSDVKVAQNETRLIYIVNIPKTEPTVFQRINLKPIKKTNNVMYKIDYGNIVKNDGIIYGVKNNCKKINELSICKVNDLVDLSKDKCIPNLLNSKHAICNTVNSHHIPRVEEIASGVILLNNFEGPIESNNTSQILRGTYLIKLQNTTITIDGQQFISEEVANIHALPPLLQPSLGATQLEEILSLELMKELHINNTKQINLIKTERKFHLWLNYAFSAAALLTGILITIIQIRKKTSTTSIAILPSPAKDEPTLQGISAPKDPQHHSSIYNLPYF